MHPLPSGYSRKAPRFLGTSSILDLDLSYKLISRTNADGVVSNDATAFAVGD